MGSLAPLSTIPLIILDEPAAGLDPKARHELKQLLRTLQGRGRTILITSHVLADLEEICTTIGILEKGRLIRVGKIEEILQVAAGPQGAAPAAPRLVRLRLVTLCLAGMAITTAHNSYFLLFYFTAWLARDLFYLQWMNVRPVRSSMRRAFLYLSVFYISTSIVFRTAMVSGASDAAAFSAWLAPFAALRSWNAAQWGSTTGAWFVALLVQAASAVGFAYLYRQQILALAPRPYAAPPAAPRLSSKPA